MRIISVVNQKGGCGKTVTAVNLSDCLALHHKKVLLIDLDPQSNATFAMGLHEKDFDKSVYDVFLDESSIRSVIKEVYPGFFIVPSRITLSAVEQILAGKSGRETVLNKILEPVKSDFDYIIIDCPPSIGLLTFNALRASSEVIIPIEASVFSLQGLGRLLSTLELLREKSDHDIKFRALATIFDQRTKFAWELYDEMKRHFGDRLYTTKIHSNVRLREAARAGKPICRFDTGSLGFFDYDQLTKEVIEEENSIETQHAALSPQRSEEGVRFCCEAPNAKSVQLVGDFNSWNPNQIYLEDKDGAGRWQKTLLLPKGSYQYRYIIDGKWVHDKDNDKTEYSPYGGVNSVISI